LFGLDLHKVIPVFWRFHAESEKNGSRKFGHKLTCKKLYH
jgi:hypothetical protein